MRALVQPCIAAALTSGTRRDAVRWAHERWRVTTGAPHRLTAYVRIDDPYAYVLLHGLERLRAAFEVELRVRAVGPTTAAMDPAPDALRAWSAEDATRVATLYADPTPRFESRVADPSDCATLVPCETASDPLLAMRETMDAWWRGETRTADPHDLQRLADNDRERARRGHYQSAMVHYAGEWYGGIDRLNHLVTRLEALGVPQRGPVPAFDARLAAPASTPGSAPADTTLEFFWSARSPYSYLALERAYTFADRHGIALTLRPVLPMVMRGLSVPLRKRLYILDDAKREADLLGIPFGWICDPLGSGVERIYALLDVARQYGRESTFVRAVSRAVWSRGLHVASDRGMASIAREVGLPWSACRRALPSDHWRAEVQANQDALIAAGHWGVPTLRLADTVVWGQDRFWVLEQAMQQLKR